MDKRYRLKKDTLYHNAGTVFEDRGPILISKESEVAITRAYVIDFNSWLEPLPTEETEIEELPLYERIDSRTTRGLQEPDIRKKVNELVQAVNSLKKQEEKV